MKPSEIHTAVLVDRGHRKFPVKAEFYGMELPTKLDEHVSVVVENQLLQNVKLTKY
jgi:pyrimidine operon attenuation protein/uracil phosphoribosyltransferase